MTGEFTDWRKSTRSAYNGSCVEVGAWRTSSYSAANGNCVEAGNGPAGIGIRDSKDPDGTVLAFSAETWQAFAAGLKSAPQP